MEKVGTRTCCKPHSRVDPALGLLSLNLKNKSEVDGLRPGCTILKTGAGFGVWDKSTPGLGESEVEYNRLSVEVFLHRRTEKEHYRVVSFALSNLKLKDAGKM